MIKLLLRVRLRFLRWAQNANQFYEGVLDGDVAEIHREQKDVKAVIDDFERAIAHIEQQITDLKIEMAEYVIDSLQYEYCECNISNYHYRIKRIRKRLRRQQSVLRELGFAEDYLKDELRSVTAKQRRRDAKIIKLINRLNA